MSEDPTEPYRIGKRNAAEIIADKKARPRKFRELPERQITCDCLSRGGGSARADTRVIARVYLGPSGGGVMAEWVWVPGQHFGGGREPVPPLAYAVPQQAGEPMGLMNAQCPRCKRGWYLLLGGNGPGTVARVPLGAPTLTQLVE